ncbi:MAG: TonB-dependent receptor [Bacteroidales bacterium]|nr:TonB-dependent receptor [Candidatus Cryptobacteroides faecihippi]
MKRAVIAFLLMLIGSASLNAQKKTISGYVTDSESGEPLIGVAVLDKSTSMGTVTGNSGFYSISLEPGQRTIVVTCLGYDEKTIPVNLNADMTLNVQIAASSDLLSGAVVTGSTPTSGARASQMSAIEVPISQIKAIPAIGGEVDVMKALQLLPGVQSGTEGTAGLYVRGGGADENLLLMDGVPLYNVNHLFGFFSVFNADALKGVTLYKGNFPARFGGHLSSVIDVRLNDGNDSEYHGNASIGLISSKFNFEGPIVKGKTTFNISARRTYMDLLAKPVIAFVNRENREDDLNYEEIGGGYDFYDLNAKLTHKFGNGDRLSLSFYTGDDAAHVHMDDISTYEIYEYGPTGPHPSGVMEKNRDRGKFGWRWGNMVTSLRWNHIVAPKLYMSSALSYTQYRNKLSVALSEYSSKLENGAERDGVTHTAEVAYNSLINDISANVDFDYSPSVMHDVKFGAVATLHSFKPGVVSMMQKASGYVDEMNNLKTRREVGDAPLSTREAALYCEDNWAVLPWLKLNLGLRTSLYDTDRKTYLSAEPRLGARALVTDKLSFKASYSEMSQYIHLLCNSNLSMPSDLWVPVTSRIKPMRSRQSAAGVFYDLGKYEFSMEGYYKTMDNVLEYKDGASYLGMATGWEDKVCMGRGWSYGLEFMAQKKIGKTTGWIGYTWAKAMRQFDRPGMVINDGNPFPAKYDRRHDLSATVTHAFSKKFDLSATFVLSSGNCGSLGYDEFNSECLTGLGPEAGFSTWYYGATYVPYRNNYRMPMYNRLDIGMNFYHKHRRGRGMDVWNLSCYNVYNHRNPFLIVVDWEDELAADGTGWTTYPVLKKVSIFPIIPSLSYTFKF